MLIYEKDPIISVLTVSVGIHFGFKALHSLKFPEESSTVPVDWHALYPQLSFASAMAYLPNQFDRGHQKVLITKLHVKKAFKLAVYLDHAFSDVSISSEEKANRVRLALSEAHRKLSVPNIDESLPLMQAFGEIGMGLIVFDADEMEIVLPHSIATEEYLAVEPVFEIEESKTIPRTVGSILGRDIKPSVLKDLTQLTAILETEVTDPNCKEMKDLIGKSLSHGAIVKIDKE